MSTTVSPPDENLLLLALAACGAEPDRDAVALAVSQARCDAPEDEARRFEAAARRCGLRVASRRARLERALRHAAPGAPVILWGAKPVVAVDRRAALIVALDDDGAEALLEESQIATRLGLSTPTQSVSFATIDRAVHVDSGDGHHVSPARRLLALLRPELGDIRALVTLSLGVSLLTLATPVAADQLVSSIAFGGLAQPIVVLSIVLAGCLGLAAAMRGLQAHVAELVQRRIMIRLLADLVHRLPRVDRAALEGLDGPELVNRFYDVVTLQKGLALLLVETFALVLSASVGLLVLGFYHPALAALDVVLVGGVLTIVLFLGRGGVETSVEESRAKHAIVAFLEELARTRDLLDSADARRHVETRGDLHARDYLRARSAHWRVVLRQTVAALGLQVFGATAVLGLGGALVLAESLTLGQLVAAEIIVTVLLGDVAKLGKHLESFYDLVAAADKIGHLLDLPIEAARPECLDGAGAASVACFSLALPGSPAGTDLAIRAGERVAITGGSGSGKSLLLARLAGFATGEGEVVIDGRSIANVDAEAVAAGVALVRDEVTLVGGTVLDNLRVGRRDVDAERARRALEDVGLGPRVSRLVDGMLTRLGPRGEPLSRGELLRLALARAIARRPRVLLIDGVLEVLDPVTRRPIVEKLVDWRAPWTLIVATTPEVAAAFDRRIELGKGAST